MAILRHYASAARTTLRLIKNANTLRLNSRHFSSKRHRHIAAPPIDQAYARHASVDTTSAIDDYLYALSIFDATTRVARFTGADITGVTSASRASLEYRKCVYVSGLFK